MKQEPHIYFILALAQIFVQLAPIYEGCPRNTWTNSISQKPCDVHL